MSWPPIEPSDRRRMSLVIALVGRPNVGKSSLFNRLVGRRTALVGSQEGLTRDRHYGIAHHDARRFVVVDTGGIALGEQGLVGLVSGHALKAAAEADLAVLVVDARAGLCADDQAVAEQVRRLGKPVVMAVNKSDGLSPEGAVAEFYALGFEPIFPTSCTHGLGIEALLAALLERVPAGVEEDGTDSGTRVAIIGRPNVGKSTLVNRILGEERMLVYEQPGTTRDSIATPFTRDGNAYVLVDTAGVRRRARVDAGVEQWSVVKTLRAIDDAQIVVLVVDGSESVTEQDLALLGLVVDSGRGLVIAVNKWDGLDAVQRQLIKKEVDRRLRFVDFAPLHYISARHGSGVGDLFASIDAAYRSAYAEVSTPQLTRLLERIVEANPPPLVRGRRVKLRYAHLGGHNPPRVLVHGSRGQLLPPTYRRYLERSLREALHLVGTPLRVEFRQGDNPYDTQSPRRAGRRAHVPAR
ncbi:MAG: ribosome biogenesis GTPase Der [Gammaproteobacteria bacterium]